MTSVKLYKESKTQFVNALNQINKLSNIRDDSNPFSLRDLAISHIIDDLNQKINNLNTEQLINFCDLLLNEVDLVLTHYEIREKLLPIIEKLASLYEADPDTYKNILKNYNSKMNPLNKANIEGSYFPGITTFFFFNYLPTFYNYGQTIKTQATKIFSGKFQLIPLNQNAEFPKYLASLLSLNQDLGKHLYDQLINENYLKDGEFKKALEAITKTNTVPEATFLYKLITTTKLGTHSLTPEYSLTNHKTYSRVKGLNNTKKALIIKGYDHNQAFGKITLMSAHTLSKKYDSITINAQGNTITLKDIKNAIQESNFQDLELIILDMHGGDPLLVSDTLLTLNKKFSSFSGSHVLGHDLLDALVSSTNGRALKIIVKSCYGQLSTNKALKILPHNSEILTFSDQGYWPRENFLLLYLDKEIHKAAVKHQYHQGSNKNIVVSYSKIDQCNLMTEDSLSKTDISTLLEKVDQDQLTSDLQKYFGNDQVSTEVTNLLNLFEQATENMPLIAMRESDNTDTFKYLSVAGAIQNIYGQCGQRILEDSNFKPQQDSFIGESLLDLVIALPGPISDVIFYLGGLISGQSSWDEL